MSGENTATSASGIYKRVYGTRLNKILPKSSVIQDRFPWSKSERVGESYQEGVQLQPPNGFSYNGEGGGVQALNAPQNGVTKQATVKPSEIVLREQMAYAAVSRAVEAGDAAFEALTEATFTAMKVAHHNRIEGSLLHGQLGYGTVESIVDNTSYVSVTFTAETWAPGMWWAFGVGSRWDSFTGNTKNNASGVLTVKNITASTRTVDFLFTGTASAEVAGGDIFFPQGAYDGSTNQDMLGLMAQASNTGTTFGLDSTLYPNWKGNSFPCGGPLSFAFVEDCLGSLRDRGAEGSILLGLSNKVYSRLIAELQALRLIPADITKGKAGFRSVSMDSPDFGEVEFLRMPFMQQGKGLFLPEDYVIRSGSSDTSLGINGSKQGDIFMYVPGYNAMEVQSFSDQFSFLQKPCHAGIITGITS